MDDQIGLEAVCDCLGWATGRPCGKCYVCHSVEVCAEVHRVLRDDGTLWWNVGDTYAGSGAGSGKGGKMNLPSGNLTGVPWRVALALQAWGWVLRSDMPWVKRNGMPESTDNRPNKSLEYVFLLTKGTKYYFDMEAVKKEAVSGDGPLAFGTRQADAIGKKPSGNQLPENYNNPRQSTRNYRNSDLWFASVDTPHGITGVGDEIVGLDVTTKGYAGAHFACYSPKLIEPMILAGTSERGCCAGCGAPWERVVEKSGAVAVDAETKIDRSLGNSNGLPGSGSTLNAGGGVVPTTTVGWEPGCECNGDFVTTRELVVVVVKRVDAGVDNFDRDHSLVSNRSGKDSTTLDPGVETVEVEEWQNVTRYVLRVPMADHPLSPCVVLDPFVGSGTTVATAISLGRVGVGVDLSEEYLREHAVPRIRAAIGDRQRALVEAGVTEPPAISELVDAAPVRAVAVPQRTRPAPRIVG